MKVPNLIVRQFEIFTESIYLISSRREKKVLFPQKIDCVKGELEMLSIVPVVLQYEIRMDSAAETEERKLRNGDQNILCRRAYTTTRFDYCWMESSMQWLSSQSHVASVSVDT
jgi:hypothetical protein